jgi:hypothetical protein
MAFHLGEVKVRSCTSLDKFVSIVEKVETEIENTAGNRFTIHDKMFLVKMPTSRTKQGKQTDKGTVREYRTMRVASFLSVRSLYSFPFAALKSIFFRMAS